MRREIAAVIPCLNEGGTIRSLIRDVRAYIPHVIVVNDGSTDRTAEEARLAEAIVIDHATPKGKGYSLREGFHAATERGFKWALAMDGDGQHAPADIPRFLERASESSAAMLIGDRMNHLRSMPRVRRFVNRWMSETIGNFCQTRVPDSQCGFRMVRLQEWNQIHFSAENFEIESEMIVRFLKAGHGIEFVPVETRYAGECSKVHPWRDTVRWFRWWFGIKHEFSRDFFAASTAGYKTTPQDATA